MSSLYSLDDLIDDYTFLGDFDKREETMRRRIESLKELTDAELFEERAWYLSLIDRAQDTATEFIERLAEIDAEIDMRDENEL